MIYLPSKIVDISPTLAAVYHSGIEPVAEAVAAEAIDFFIIAIVQGDNNGSDCAYPIDDRV